MIYTVMPGDTLFLLARRFNTTIESIMALNNLTSTSLTAGQRIIIPLYTEVVVNVDRANVRTGAGVNYPVKAVMVRGARLPVIGDTQGWYRVVLFDESDGWISATTVNRRVYGGEKPIIVNVGFYTLEEGPTLPSSFNSFVNNTAQISQLPIFMWRISQSNPTTVEKFGQFTDQEVRTLVAIAHRNNIKIMPVVHNLLYRPGGVALAKDIVRELVRVPQNRTAFAFSLVRLIEQYNFDGVNIDIEDVHVEDSQNLSALFMEISRVLRSRGYYFSASVPSRISDEPFNPFSDPFDYSVIGQAVDQFVVMLYNEFGWPGSPPGPPVTIGWMDRVVRYTMTKMPAWKIVAAVSVFGFDFNLDTGRNTYVTYEMAVNRAANYNSEIIFDEETQTPMFSYTDAQGNRHEVWFEDTRSLRAKIDLAWRLGISGVALWRLGMEDPGIWNMLANEVVVKKLY